MLTLGLSMPVLGSRERHVVPPTPTPPEGFAFVVQDGEFVLDGPDNNQYVIQEIA